MKPLGCVVLQRFLKNPNNPIAAHAKIWTMA